MGLFLVAGDTGGSWQASALVQVTKFFSVRHLHGTGSFCQGMFCTFCRRKCYSLKCKHNSRERDINQTNKQNKFIRISLKAPSLSHFISQKNTEANPEASSQGKGWVGKGGEMQGRRWATWSLPESAAVSGLSQPSCSPRFMGFCHFRSDAKCACCPWAVYQGRLRPRAR